jgi:hypothetical protein
VVVTLRGMIAACATEPGAAAFSGGEVALRRGNGRLPLAFVLEIIKGDGRQAAADQLGITVGTARSHLSRIFHKTKSRRQAELVRLLLDV